MKHRKALVLVTAVAAIVAVVVPLAWWAGRPSGDAGSLDRFVASAREHRPQPSFAPPTGVATHSARLGDQPTGPTAPTVVRIGAIGVDAPVVPVGLRADGSMEIPDSVAQVGWYRLGAVPGRTGSAVLAGHVDSRTQGRGAFFDLRALEPGARITVTDRRGTETPFEVVARRQFPKAELPADLFATTGPPRLALITCGGDFDQVRHSYRDNVVVYAVAA